MMFDLSMPWWAWGYLIIQFCLLSMSCFPGVRSQYVDNNPKRMRHEIIASACSLLSVCIFVIAYFHGPLMDLFHYGLIPMFLMGVYWECTSVKYQLAYARHELEHEDLSDEERNFLLNAAIAFNVFFVVPGYFAGCIVCLRVLGVI